MELGEEWIDDEDDSDEVFRRRSLGIGWRSLLSSRFINGCWESLVTVRFVAETDATTMAEELSSFSIWSPASTELQRASPVLLAGAQTEPPPRAWPRRRSATTARWGLLLGRSLYITSLFDIDMIQRSKVTAASLVAASWSGRKNPLAVEILSCWPV